MVWFIYKQEQSMSMIQTRKLQSYINYSVSTLGMWISLRTVTHPISSLSSSSFIHFVTSRVEIDILWCSINIPSFLALFYSTIRISN